MIKPSVNNSSYESTPEALGAPIKLLRIPSWQPVHMRTPEPTHPVPQFTTSVMSAADPNDDESYIDYEAFLSPDFSAYTFANTLITSTNDPNDPNLDLSTPLSRVLFDLQEIDTHIHNLTSTSAIPLLNFTQSTTTASSEVLGTITSQLTTLQATYQRLHTSITTRSQTAQAVLTATTNLHATTTALRDISRAVVLARQLDVQLPELSTDPKALVRAAHTLREMRSATVTLSNEITIVQELNSLVITPAEKMVAGKSRELIVDAFGNGGNPAAAAAAASALYNFSPNGLVGAMQAGLNAAVNGALVGLKKSLKALTMLDRAVELTVGRCKGVVGVEGVLEDEVLKVVLDELDTVALWASFWRAVARGLEAEARAVIQSGGSNARILRGARDRVRQALRTAVEKGLEGVEVEKEGMVAIVVNSVNVLGRN